MRELLDCKPFIRNMLLAAAVLGGAFLGTGCGREAPVYAPGAISVTSVPPGAAILFDGVDTGEITPHTFADLPANRYRVTVSLPAYGVSAVTDQFGQFRLQVNAAHQAEVELLAQKSGYRIHEQYATLGNTGLSFMMQEE